MKGESRIFILLCLISLAACSVGRPTRIHFLDVGEGSATLIDSPQLGRILIDAGNPGSAVVSKLNALGVTKLDSLFLTHPHPDHVGGAYSVVEFLNPSHIYDNGEILTPDKPEERWYMKSIRASDKYRVLKAGDIFEKNDSKLEVLSPTSLDGDWNTNSLVIRFKAYDSIVLLMADGNFQTEERLLSNGVDLNADILQVGHHGAQDSSSAKFLESVSPKFAVISVDKNNSNGYPSSTTFARVKETGAIILITAHDGTITFTLSKNKNELPIPNK